jgi:ferredoxin
MIPCSDTYGHPVQNKNLRLRRYILWEAEDEGLQLPYACRMGCCTACAVRVDEGRVWQPEALGISRGLREKGYALMCVGFPESDCVLSTVEEDELYEKQFGKPFAELAVDKNSIFVDRDDYALELAEMDE